MSSNFNPTSTVNVPGGDVKFFEVDDATLSQQYAQCDKMVADENARRIARYRGAWEDWNENAPRLEGLHLPPAPKPPIPTGQEVALHQGDRRKPYIRESGKPLLQEPVVAAQEVKPTVFDVGPRMPGSLTLYHVGPKDTAKDGDKYEPLGPTGPSWTKKYIAGPFGAWAWYEMKFNGIENPS